MKNITNLMINIFNIKKLGYDFMGYETISISNGIYTFHHLVIPKSDGGTQTIDNGAILLKTPHEYLHLIQKIDGDKFFDITMEMIDINIKRKIDMENLKHINSILDSFEREHLGDIRNDSLLIKPEYQKRLLKHK